MEIVIYDLNKYLRKNIFPSKTVLVFPPFNGFRRFLIHKLIEDNFASAEVAAFSIGQDINRRIVVCYKGLVRTDQNTLSSGQTQKVIIHNMIEAEGQTRQKSSPTVAVYRPPAARIAETRLKVAESKSDVSKRCRVRRPDQQMYVPRPKRASFGDEQPRSRSRSSSQTSLENDSCEKRKSSSRQSVGEKKIPSEINDSLSHLSSEQDHQNSKDSSRWLVDKKNTKSLTCLKSSVGSDSSKKDDSLSENNDETIHTNTACTCSSTYLNHSSNVNCKNIPIKCKCDKTVILEEETGNIQVSNTLSESHDLRTENSIGNHMLEEFQNEHIVLVEDKNHSDECNINVEQERSLSRKKDSLTEDSGKADENNRIQQKVCSNEVEAVETIFLSSDSRDSTTSTSSDTKDSCSTSRSQDENCDKMEIEQHNECMRSAGFDSVDSCSTDGDQNGNKSSVKMETELHSNSTRSKSDDSRGVPRKEKVSKSSVRRSKEMNLKNKTVNVKLPVTNDVLIISHSSSSVDDLNYSTEQEPNSKVKIEESKKPVKVKVEKPAKRNKIVNPEEADWEALYDDSGECLVPDLMAELTNSVGSVRITTADSDYRPYQSLEERSNDGECVIEIYDFPAEFKTSDLMNIFAAYRNKNFQIKWVDDTHALGVFPSPLMADEVLACTLPFVKTRPLRLGIAESRSKARTLILPALPSAERPKTCTALARRLVSGALGLRLPTSSQDREKEKQVLKEAREKRRLEAKQREAAWDGSLTSSSCI